MHLIFGEREEPFLEAALRSVEWADYVCAVNTAPTDSETGWRNEQMLWYVFGSGSPKVRLERLPMEQSKFDFARARNACLDLADDGDWVFILDADDVHWPTIQEMIERADRLGFDMLAFHFAHLAVYKDLLHSIRYREIVFVKDLDTWFEKGVHEMLIHRRQNRLMYSEDHYLYDHLGYIKPAREVASRWEFYRSLGSEVHEYDRDDPDHALDAWVDICTPWDREHPPAVRKTLERFPGRPA